MTSTTPTPIPAPDWDVLIVGRSYAGLSAALVLGRARRSVLVVGSGGPRNEAVHHTHGLLGHDGVGPSDLVAAAEKELGTYPSVELVDARVGGIEALGGAGGAGADGRGGFRASLGGRPTTAGLVILATGANDNPPPVPGLAEHWGRGVFTCPYCDGFEHGDTHLALLGAPDFVPHMARVLTGWSDRITAFTGGLDPSVRDDLRVHGVAVEERPIARVRGDGSAVTVLELDDGTEVPVGAVFLAQLPTPNSGLAVGLGCDVDDLGFVVIDANRRTTVDGVWAIGDVANRRANMALSIADGVAAASDCSAQLLDRDWTTRTAG